MNAVALLVLALFFIGPLVYVVWKARSAWRKRRRGQSAERVAEAPGPELGTFARPRELPNRDLEALLSRQGLARIQAVAQDGAALAAAKSLAAWGVINVGAWFLLGAENRGFLSRLANPTVSIYLLLYGGLVLGVAMLAFSALGYRTRLPATISVDGLALIGVGIWNIVHDFVAIGALRPYGYTIEKPATVWVVLGLCQLVWGSRQLSRSRRILAWRAPQLTTAEVQQLRGHLQAFVVMAEDPETGIVAASTTEEQPFTGGLVKRTTRYTGRLLEDCALMVASKLDDCFMIDRKAMGNASFFKNGGLRVQGGPKGLLLEPRSVIEFKKWGGRPVHATDLTRAETAGAQEALPQTDTVT